MQTITNISADILKVHPRNEEFFDDIQGEEYERFKRSILDDGLLSPLVVSPDMTVISGHQRLKACLELGYKTVPVIILEDVDDEDDKLRKLIAANFGRLKNDPIKQSKLIVEYEKLCGVRQGSAYQKADRNNFAQLTQEDIAKQLGTDVRTLQNFKRLSSLSPDLQQIISDGHITPTTGFKVLVKLSEQEQADLIKQLPAAQKLTQAQVQEYVDKLKEKDNIIPGYQQKERVRRTAAKDIPNDYESILEELTRTKEELKRANFVQDNREDAPNVAKKFDVDSLYSILHPFSMDIGIYQYIDDEINSTEQAKLKQSMDVIDDISATLKCIRTKMEDAVPNLLVPKISVSNVVISGPVPEEKVKYSMGVANQEQFIEEQATRLHETIGIAAATLYYYTNEEDLCANMSDDYKKLIKEQGEKLISYLQKIFEHFNKGSVG